MEIDNFDKMQKSPVIFFRYTIQMIIFIISIYLVHLNFTLMNVLLAFVLLISSEALLEIIENSKYSKINKKDILLKRIVRYIDRKYHIAILLISFIIRLILYFKLDLEYDNFECYIGIANCLCGSIISLFIYLIAKELFSRRTAQIISFLYSISIATSSYCVVIIDYHIFAVLILIAIYLLISKRYVAMNYILKNCIIGLLLAISTIIRIEGIIYILSVIIYLFSNSLIKNNNRKEKYISIALIVSIFIFVNLLVIGVMKVTNIEWTLSLNKNIDIFNNKIKSIEEFELNQNEYWNNTYYEYLGKEFNKNIVNKIDSAILLFCYINAAILVIYCKIKNIEDERMYILYIIIIMNFFIFGFVKNNNEYSYISKIVIYILAAGGLTIFKKNAEFEAREKFGVKLLGN